MPGASWACDHATPGNADRMHYPRAMHFDALTGPEQRVLGCLIEKRFTTPDQYPLSHQRAAPGVQSVDEPRPGRRLPPRDRARPRRSGSRATAWPAWQRTLEPATKYRHLAEEALGLGREQLAVLAVLLLRGPQTAGELRTRSERVVDWPSLAAVEQVLNELTRARLRAPVERRPGQKEERFVQAARRRDCAHGRGARDRDAPAAGQKPSPARRRQLSARGRTRDGRRRTSRAPRGARTAVRAARDAVVSELLGR